MCVSFGNGFLLGELYLQTKGIGIYAEAAMGWV